jgi:hypothetical protein
MPSPAAPTFNAKTVGHMGGYMHNSMMSQHNLPYIRVHMAAPATSPFACPAAKTHHGRMLGNQGQGTRQAPGPDFRPPGPPALTAPPSSCCSSAAAAAPRPPLLPPAPPPAQACGGMAPGGTGLGPGPADQGGTSPQGQAAWQGPTGPCRGQMEHQEQYNMALPSHLHGAAMS